MENLIISPSVPEAGFEKIFFVWRLVVKEAGSCTVCVCVWSPTMHTHAETHHHMIQGQRAACLQRNLTWVLFLFQLLKAKRLKAVKTEEAEKSRKWAEIKDLMNYSRFSADLHQINVKTFKISLIAHTVQIKKKKKPVMALPENTQWANHDVIFFCSSQFYI